MKIKLGSKFMKGLVSKIITSTIRKKLGYKVDVNVEGFSVEIDGSDVRVNANVTANMKYSELTNIIAEYTTPIIG